MNNPINSQEQIEVNNNDPKDTASFSDNENYILNEVSVEPSLLEQIHYGQNGVNPATGNFSRAYTDINLNAPGFSHIGITRTYNSKDSETEARPFGRGWSFNFESYMEESKVDEERFTIHMPSGAVLRFFEKTSGVYEQDISNGDRYEFERINTNTFKLIDKNQNKYIYVDNRLDTTENKYWLMSIEDRYGNTITINRDSSYKITSVVDQAGRTYSISYNSKNLIEKITDNSIKRFITYNYYDNELLKEVIDPMGNKTYTYEYDDKKLLIKVMDADMKLIEELSYHSSTDNKVGSLTVHNSDTVSNKYNYYYYIEFTRIVDSEGRVIEKWFDKSNFITKTVDPEGKETSVQYKHYPKGFNWTYKYTLGIGRVGISAAAIGSDLYISGGLTYIRTVGTNCKYETDTKTQKYDTTYGSISDYFMDFPPFSAVTTYGEKIYHAGGRQITDYVAGTYQRTNYFGYATTSFATGGLNQMNYARQGAALVVLNGYFYVIGGDDNTLKIVEKRSVNGGEWTRVSDTINQCLSQSSRGHNGGGSNNFAVVFNGKIYAVDIAGCLEEYDPLKEGTSEYPWRVINQDVPKGSLIVHNNKLYIINAKSSGIFQYDFSKSHWIHVGNCEWMELVDDYNVVSINGKLYIVYGNISTGYDEAPYDNYDPSYIFEGAPTSETVNRYGEEKEIIDRNGNKTTYDRDDRGNITKITNPDLSYREYAYDEKNNLIKEKDEEGKLTFYVYDQQKVKLIEEVQPLDGSTEYIYGSSDRSKFAITTYTYYNDGENGYKAKGLLKTVTDPEGNVTTYTYNISGDVATIKDGANKTVTYQYNNAGWKIAEVTAKGFTTSYEYDLNGRIVRVKLNGGETTRIVYNKMGRKVREVSAKLYDASLDGLNSTPVNYDYTGNHGNRISYYRNGKVKFYTDAENNTTNYTYDKYGNLTQEEKPNGGVYVHNYDIMNRLKEVRFKESTSSTTDKLLESYDYTTLTDGKTQKTHIKYLNDTENATTVLAYDNRYKLVNQQNPDLTNKIITYYSNGQIKTTRDENGNTTYYNYDTLNRLKETWIPIEFIDGKVKYSYTEKVYYKNGLVKEEKTGKEKVEYPNKATNYIINSYTYYGNGKVFEVKQNNQTKIRHYYDHDNNLSREEAFTDATNYITTKYENNYFGKPHSKVLVVRNGDIHNNDLSDNTTIELTTSYTYDKNRNIETVINPENVTTILGYDNLNRVISTSYGDSYINDTLALVSGDIITTKAYNWEGKVLTGTDPKGNVTEYSYNKRGMLEKVINKNVTIDNVKTDIVNASYYDNAGRIIAKVLPKYYDSTKSYTQLNRTEYSYDLFGRIKTEKQIYYDTKLNQWISYISKAYKYDANGNVVKELDALGYEAGTGSTVDEKINTGYGKVYTYTPSNKIETMLDPVVSKKLFPFTTKYTYDTRGNLVSEANAKGVITNYYYTDSGKLEYIKVKASASEAEKTIQYNTYDYMGNLISQQDGNGNTVSMNYNAFAKVSKATYPEDETINTNVVTYQYDKNGNLRKQEDSFGTVDEYTYNNAGKQTHHTRKSSSGVTDPIITAYTRYCINGNVRLIYIGQGAKTEFTYDELNRVITESVTVAGVNQTKTNRYDKNNNLVSTSDWRGNTYTYEYDPLNRIVSKKDTNNIEIEKLEYNKNNAQVKSYDALNNMTEFIYDENNRLVKTIDPELHTTIQNYDEVGNIAIRTDGNNNTTTYEYNEFNQLVSVTNALLEITSFTYDLNGNMLTQKNGRGYTTTYKYNVANKLIEIKNDGTNRTETYTYYPNGLLKTKKDKNGATTTFVYDCHGRLKLKQTGSLSVSYTYDDNGVLARENSGCFYQIA